MERESVITVSLIDEEQLSEVRALVADRYKDLAPDLNQEKTEKKLYGREYPHTFTIGAFKDGRLVGTTQLITAGTPEESNLPAIDAMLWMNNANQWPHSHCHIPETAIGEIGRFALAREIPKEEYPIITCELFKAATLQAREMGVEILYAIMPGYMEKVLNQAKVNIRSVREATLKKTEEATQLFTDFKIYWELNNPRLFEFIDYRNGHERTEE